MLVRPASCQAWSFWSGVGAVIAGTFVPWREAAPPLFVSSEGFDGWFLAGLAAVLGGVVGLVMLARRSNIRLGLAGTLVALMVGLLILILYSTIADEHSSSRHWGPVLTLIPDIGPGPYVSAVGVIVMLVGSVIGLAKPRVAAATTPQREGQEASRVEAR